MIRNVLAIVQEAAGAEHAPQGGPPDLQGMLMHHLTDAKELDLPGAVVHLPQFEPLHLGPLVLDMSPTKHVVFMVLAAILCVLLFVSVARTTRRRDPGKAPKGMANAIEALVLYFRDDVVRANIGEGADKYTPYILTLFFFILFMNLLGLVPYGATPTGDLSVTATLAIMTFIVVEISGMVTLGAMGYARTIFYIPAGLHPVMGGLMLLVMVPVEFLGKLTKPFALAIRLFANMTAGHTLVLSLLGIIFLFGTIPGGRWAIAASAVGMTTAVMLLEVFVAFLQAYIFAMLTAVFIGLIRHADAH